MVHLGAEVRIAGISAKWRLKVEILNQEAENIHVKEILRRIARFGFVRAVVRIVLVVADGVSRLASVLRTAAIFPGNVLPSCHWSVTVKFGENVICGSAVVIGPNTTLGA